MICSLKIIWSEDFTDDEEPISCSVTVHHENGTRLRTFVGSTEVCTRDLVAYLNSDNPWHIPTNPNPNPNSPNQGVEP